METLSHISPPTYMTRLKIHLSGSFELYKPFPSIKYQLTGAIGILQNVMNISISFVMTLWLHFLKDDKDDNPTFGISFRLYTTLYLIWFGGSNLKRRKPLVP